MQERWSKRICTTCCIPLPTGDELYASRLPLTILPGSLINQHPEPARRLLLSAQTSSFSCNAISDMRNFFSETSTSIVSPPHFNLYQLDNPLRDNLAGLRNLSRTLPATMSRIDHEMNIGLDVTSLHRMAYYSAGQDEHRHVANKFRLWFAQMRTVVERRAC